MRTILLTFALIFPSIAAADAPVLFTPAHPYEFAAKDTRTLAHPSHYRYLSSYHATTPAQLQDLYEQAAFVTNSLNFHYQAIVLPEKLEGGRLLRINIYELGITPEAWDNLGQNGSGIAPFPEPYFHFTIDGLKQKPTRWNGYAWEWSEPYKERIVATAEHIAKPYAVELLEKTGTQFPIYRTDWFCTFAMQAPAYLVFQGNPKDFNDLLKLAGVDPKQFDKTAVALRGATLFSEVTERNRVIERVPTDRNYGRGSFYHTFDYFTSVGPNDVFQNLLIRKRDAGEAIWTNPNGLLAWGLFAFDKAKNDEKVIDFADPKAAIDNRTLRHNKLVISGMSCVHCHAKGAILVNDEVRTVSQATVATLVTDPKDAKRVGDVYFGADLNSFLLADQANYAAAIKAATGKDPAAIALAYEDMVHRYLDGQLSADDVAVEMGYAKETLLPLISEASRTGALDHSFVRLLRDRRARRDQFEAAYGQLQRLLIRVPAK